MHSTKQLRIVILLWAVCLSSTLHAQNLRKAQRLWENQDWQALKTELEEGLEKEEQALGEKYLYSRLYTHAEGYPQRLDSALYWIRAAQRAWPLTDDRSQARYTRFGVTPEAVAKQKRWIDSAGYQQTLAEGTESAYQVFITRHFDAPQLPEAQTTLYRIAFEKAKEADTYRAYATFVEQYAGAPQVAQALNLSQAAAFREQTGDDKPESYTRFLTRFPKSPYRAQAEERLLALTTLSYTVDELSAFLERYPKSTIRSRVVGMLYHLQKSKGRTTEWLAATTQWPEWDSLLTASQLEQDRLFPLWQDSVYRMWHPHSPKILAPSYTDLPDSVCANGWPHAWFPLRARTGLYQITTRDGRPVMEDAFQDTRDLGQGFLALQTHDSWGVWHLANFQVLPASYRWVERLGEAYFAALTAKGWTFFSSLGEPSMLPPAEDYALVGPHLLLRQQGKWAVLPMDQLAGTFRQAPTLTYRWEEFEYLPSQELILFGTRGEALMNPQGQLVLPENEWSLEDVGFGWVAESERGFALALRGRTTLEATIYRNVQYTEGWLALKNNQRWALLHPSEDFNPEFQFDSVLVLGEDLFYVEQADRRYLLFSEAREKDLQPDQKVRAFRNPGSAKGEDWCYVSGPDSAWVYTETGKRIWQGLSTLEVGRVGDHHLRLRKKEAYGLWSDSGRLAVPIIFDGIGQPQRTFIPLLKDGLFGVYWTQADTVTASEWDRVPLVYSDTLAVGFREDKAGLFSATGREHIPAEYDEIRYWNDTAALCRSGYSWQVRNIANDSLLWDNLLQVTPWLRGEFVVKTNTGFGLVHPIRGELIAPELETLEWIGASQESVDGFWRGENYVPAAAWMVYTYFDRYGRRLYRQVVDDLWLDAVYCE